jgi:hypothetical protein
VEADDDYFFALEFAQQPDFGGIGNLFTDIAGGYVFEHRQPPLEFGPGFCAYAKGGDILLEILDGYDAVMIADERQGIFVDIAFDGFGKRRIEFLIQIFGGDGAEAGEAEPVFGAQHPLDVDIHFFLCEAAFAEVAFNFAESGFHIFGENEDVVAGEERFGFYFAGFEMFGDAFHFEGIGEGEPPETEFLAEEFGDGVSRQGGRPVGAGVEGGYVEVGYHDAADALFEHFPERKELDAVEACAIVPDDGQVVMRVNISIAMAGEVFGASHHAVILHAFSIHKAFHGHVFPVFAE